jgi:site-specific DNA-methyltransferase (adenine-specific)
MVSEVFNGDCMEYMARYPDKYFELAIVDPPYGIGFDRENTSMSAGTRKDGSKRKMTSWSNPKEKGYAIKEWDKSIPNEDYFIELKRVSKRQIIWGGNYFTEHLTPSGGWVVWEKGVPEGMSLSQAEIAWTNCLNSIRVVKVLWAGYIKSDSEERSHPTQKPVKLYRWLLQNYAKPGDKILDTHMGSQSSRIAAHDMGFDYYGSELDRDYFDAGCKRYENHIKQLTIFTSPSRG